MAGLDRVRTLNAVETALASHTPSTFDGPATLEAAVACVFRERAGDLEALLIRRADHDQDRWSGDLAFPGGRIEPGDRDARAAAERETREELALDLSGVRAFGRIDGVVSHAESIVVSAFAYGIQGEPLLERNHEVRDAFWVPLGLCTDPSRQIRRVFQRDEREIEMPAIRLFDDERVPVLWGITYKLLEHFMQVIGRPIPYMPWDETDG